MEQDQNELRLLSGWDLDDLLVTVNNADDIANLTEEFEPDERFLSRISLQAHSMEDIYGHQQRTFNQRCEVICLTLLRVLIETQNDPNALTTAFEPCWAGLRDSREEDGDPLDPAYIADCILITRTGTPVETFFSFIGYFRYLLAATAEPREEAWQDFGANRYLGYLPSDLNTPLRPDRYQPSVERGRGGAAFEDYMVYVEQQQLEGLERALENGRIRPEEIDEKMAGNRVLNKSRQSFKINKYFGGCLIQFASVDQWKTLLNNQVEAGVYDDIYHYMNEIFLRLFTEPLSPPDEFLDRVFRIQFWFIHLMPFYRGSLAAMNFFRYVMIAYYNHRAAEAGRPNLPIAPPRTDYFPDLEALFCCRTEEDFVAGSMSEYYCVDFRAYCDQ